MLLPHPALSPVPDPSNPASVREQENNESTYRRLLVRGMLALLLPSEDWENDCVRTLVEEMVAEMILGQILAGRMSQGRFWFEAVIKGVQSRQENSQRLGAARDGGQSVEKQRQASPSKKATRRPVLSTAFGSFLQYALIAWSILRFLIISIVAYPSLPPRVLSDSRPGSPRSSERVTRPAEVAGAWRREKRPILSMSIWSCISHTLNVPGRMPWLDGALQLLRHGLMSGPGRVGATDRPLDR